MTEKWCLAEGSRIKGKRKRKQQNVDISITIDHGIGRFLPFFLRKKNLYRQQV